MSKTKTELKLISLDKISEDPSQPRHLIYDIAELLAKVEAKDPQTLTIFESLATLATSILEVGLQQPISVYPTGDRYTIYDGHRRWLAVKLLYHQGQHDNTIECYVRERPEQEEATLLGQLNVNSQREALNVFELARSLRKVFDHLRQNGGSVRYMREDGSIGITEVSPGTADGEIWGVVEKMAGIGRSRRYQIMAVIENLPESIQQQAEQTGIPEGKLRYLIPLKDEQIQERVIQEVLTQNLPNAEIKARIETIQNELKQPASPDMPKPIEIESALKPIKRLVTEIDGVKNVQSAISDKDPRTVARYREVIPELRSVLVDIQRVINELEHLEVK